VLLTHIGALPQEHIPLSRPPGRLRDRLRSDPSNPARPDFIDPTTSMVKGPTAANDVDSL